MRRPAFYQFDARIRKSRRDPSEVGRPQRFGYKSPLRDPTRNGMLDPKLIRDNPQAIKEATRVKRIASPERVDEWLAADAKRRAAQTQADGLKSEQKKVGDQVGQLKRTLKGGTSPELEQVLQ